MDVKKTESREEEPITASFHKQLKERSLAYRSVPLRISSYFRHLKATTSHLQIFWCLT